MTSSSNTVTFLTTFSFVYSSSILIFICVSSSAPEPKEFFKGAYKLLIGKERGPLLAKFILTIGLDKFKGLVEQL